MEGISKCDASPTDTYLSDKKRKKTSFPLPSTPDDLWIKSTSRRHSHRVHPDQIFWPVNKVSSNVAFLHTSPPEQGPDHERVGEEFVITQKDEESPVLTYGEISEETRSVCISHWFTEQRVILTQREYAACMTMKSIVGGNQELLIRYVVYDGRLFDQRSRKTLYPPSISGLNDVICKNVGVMWPFELNKSAGSGGVDIETGAPIRKGTTTPDYDAPPPSLVYRIRVSPDHSGEEDSGALSLFNAQEHVVHQIPASCIDGVLQAIRSVGVSDKFKVILDIDSKQYKVMDPAAFLDDNVHGGSNIFYPACCTSYKKDSTGKCVRDVTKLVPRVNLDLPLFGGVPCPKKGSEDAQKVDIFIACLVDPQKDPSNYKSRKRCFDLALVDTQREGTIARLRFEIERLKTDASYDAEEMERLNKLCDERLDIINEMKSVISAKPGQRIVLESGCFLYTPQGQDVLVLNQGESRNDVVRISCPLDGSTEIVVPSPPAGPL
jgi:hypothetical protein